MVFVSQPYSPPYAHVQMISVWGEETWHFYISECECGRAEKDAIETEADYVAPERETFVYSFFF